MRVDLSSSLRRRLRRELGRAGRVEIGGVLMAEQIEPGHFRLEDFTVDGQRGGAAHFVRSVEEHSVALNAFFERTDSDFSRFNYLGEWHSHPNHLPIPSREDIGSMTSLVDGERDIPFALLLVVRRTWRTLLLTATLFERGRPPQPVEVIIC
jgi:hypothetical protein